MYNKSLGFLKLILSVLLLCFAGNIYAADSQEVNFAVYTMPEVSAPVSLPDLQKNSPTPSESISRMPSVIPSPPDLKVESYILIDANSGHIIAEKDSNKQVYPASLTKVMTLYLTATALRSAQLHFDDQVTVSEKAWRMDGARMFIKVGTKVSAEDLIKGIVIASGNDATVAMAEHLAGTEEAFADLMNQTAQSLNMANSNFTNSSGVPGPNHYSTAFDLAVLTRAWISNFPEYYPWFKEKWINYNGIKQPNRNRLLWRDSTVDGVKTGLTDEAGYCLIASAMRNGTRLIAVVMGAKDDAFRAKYTLALLNYGFRFFETRKLFDANTSLTDQKVFLGKENISSLGVQTPLYVTVPKGEEKRLKAKAEVNGKLKAPIVKGEIYGKININLDGKVVASKPLVALKDNPKANFLFCLYDYFLMLFHK